MCQIRSIDLRNEAVLRYLEAERVAPPGTNAAWVIDGYSLATHPDLCDRIAEVDAAAGNAAELRYLYGKLALVAPNGVIVAFGGGTYVLAIRLPRNEVDPGLLGEIHGDAPRLEALTARGWTLVDAWTVDLLRDEGLGRLAALIVRAVENAAT
ncbi:MAG TPA: hypothetical protein VF872_01490 [Gaiellaceae bacterium]